MRAKVKIAGSECYGELLELRICDSDHHGAENGPRYAAYSCARRGRQEKPPAK